LTTVTLIGMVIGLIPLFLSLIDYAAARRTVVELPFAKIDFSRADIKRGSVELPDNIGRPGPIISDSAPMEIVAALEAATENQVVRLDIKAGAAWWVTRLLALTAGAVRVRCPRAIVFVGEKENVQGAFLGWSTPPLLLKAILADTEPRGGKNVTYAAVYRTASVIAKQFATFGGLGELPDLPFPPPPAKFPLPPGQPYPPLPSQTQRYLDDARYAKLGEAALEQILMDQLALYQLEDP